MSLRAEQVSFRIGAHELLRPVDFTLEPGQVHAILGANGAGKSTLLRLLSRERLPTSGQVTLDGQTLSQWDAQALARRRAVLPQSESLRFAFTAAQVVALGRLPCRQHEAAREAQIIDETLQLADALHLRERLYPTLSGGERQRVQFARVLAQIWEAQTEGARYLLLDEPTASLDMKHQHDCLRSAREFSRTGVGVAAVLHDPNLALRYADEVSLLCQGALIAAGPPSEVLTRENLQRVYGVEVQRVDLNGHPHLAVI